MSLDAFVIGSGPNGLAAAVTLAQAGRSVVVREGAATPGGGLRSEALTLPEFQHDVCSAVHPLAVASPFFRRLPLQDYGLEWIDPGAPVAHPFSDGTAVIVERSIGATATQLGVDGGSYKRLFEPFAGQWAHLLEDALAPPHVPRHPWLLARFGRHALRSAAGLAVDLFQTDRARAVFAGFAAHAVRPLESPVTAAFGLVLGLAAHTVGWPIPAGGSRRVAKALCDLIRTLGGTIEVNAPVAVVEDLPAARAVLCDVTPRQLLRLAGRRFPPRYRRRLTRYQYGPGVFKMDWALRAPIPWTAVECRRAGTLHLGGGFAEICEAERAPWEGRAVARPFVLLAQPSLFDPSRAPAGRHTAWAYCHVPHAWPGDMAEAIEAQVERFAPGFRDCIIGRHAMGPAELEARNPNLVGGDIGGGANTAGQLWFRPALRPYRTPARHLYLCSSSTPPGGGVHGMCGYYAARAALAHSFR